MSRDPRAGRPQRTAPLADRLRTLTSGRRTINFHALPLRGVRRSLPPELDDRYAALLDGGTSDVSFSGRALDSFFAPVGPLAAAQEAAAVAFGADSTYFVTGGTTQSNRIALDALGGPGSRLLLDGSSHQSMTFASTALGMEVTTVNEVQRGSVMSPDLDSIAEQLRSAYRAGRPFTIVAITASSYDGRILRFDHVLPRLMEASPGTAILIDSAWTAIHSFHKDVVQYTALRAARDLRLRGATLPRIIVTMSAHKSMCALRQGSYLHALGTEVDPSIRRAVFTNHTTSPSWTMLASLDLARLHAEMVGQAAVSSAIRLREDFASSIRTDPLLQQVIRNANTVDESSGVFFTDPMRMTLDVSDLGESGRIRQRLFDEFGIYIARCSPAGLTLHFHIGVDASDVAALLGALHSLARERRMAAQSEISRFAIGSLVDCHVIPYPPGVPIAGPGDVWTSAHDRTLREEGSAGAEIFYIPTRDVRGNIE
ncbi:arginine/lysine/ornithine decarboxylase [Rathayibacter agropyri]|nr:hypothetical protein [Rathayibacter agropyri]